MSEDWGSLLSEDEDRIVGIIARDDEDEFTSFLKSSLVVHKPSDLVKVKLKFGEFELCPYKLLQWVIQYGAVHCGSALMRAKAGLLVNLNVPIYKGAFPLHDAACVLSPGLIELFLCQGAKADVQLNAIDSENNGLLPLHMALRRVSSDENLMQWTPQQSIFKLVIILCLPRMKKALESIRLLAKHTKEIKEVVRYYANDGKLIELAILLMVDRKRVMGPITFQSKDDPTLKGSLTFRECINCELTKLICLGCCLIGRKQNEDLAKICKERKAVMISTLLLLEIFERAGAVIGAYLKLKQAIGPEVQVARDVAGLLAKADFDLKDSDLDITLDGSCPVELVLEKSGDIMQEQEESDTKKTTKHGSRQSDIRMPPYSLPSCTYDRRSLWIMPNEHLRFTGTRCPWVVEPFNAPWISKPSVSSSMFPGTIEVQVKEGIKGIEQRVQDFPSSKRWVSFASSVKRGVR